jgi:hypothetical protein
LGSALSHVYRIGTYGYAGNGGNNAAGSVGAFAGYQRKSAGQGNQEGEAGPDRRRQSYAIGFKPKLSGGGGG